MSRLRTEDLSTVESEGEFRQGTAAKCQSVRLLKENVGRKLKTRDLPNVSSSTGLNQVSVLLLLLMAHFLCDFGLQSDRMAREKCRGCDKVLPWGWWLTAHGAIHGLAVALLTGVPLLGAAEMGIHILIDHNKCKGRINFTTDQILHMLCKGLWVALLGLA